MLRDILLDTRVSGWENYGHRIMILDTVDCLDKLHSDKFKDTQHFIGVLKKIFRGHVVAHGAPRGGSRAISAQL